MNIILAAGGTGGHMVPAHALAAELKARGHGVMLVTDDRGAQISRAVQGRAGPHPARRAARRRADRAAQGDALGARGPARRRAPCIASIKPDAVVGFGGYPAFPALLAASAAKVPTVLHEQNAVLGRVNRWLAGEAQGDRHQLRRGRAAQARPSRQDRAGRQSGARGGRAARRIALPAVRRHRAARRSSSPAAARARPSSARSCPRGSACCRASLRLRLQVVQQCRADDIEAVRARYAALNIPAELLTYIEDMPDAARRRAPRHRARRRLDHRRADRGGAPRDPRAAADRDRRSPDRQRARDGQGRRRADRSSRPNSRPPTLAAQVEAIASDPQALANAAGRALSVGRPHATRDLADLVERIANRLSPVEVGPRRRAKPPPQTSPSGPRHEGDGHRDRARSTSSASAASACRGSPR